MTNKENLPKESNYFNYTKTILDKVSFDSSIFSKEFKKAKQLLSKDEFVRLKVWSRKHFNDSIYHRDLSL